uniref:Uncharacterized protein n=1 Tax=Setaria italica TaxID=4555 RepID=K3ZBI6_SETIT
MPGNNPGFSGKPPVGPILWTPCRAGGLNSIVPLNARSRCSSRCRSVEYFGNEQKTKPNCLVCLLDLHLV